MKSSDSFRKWLFDNISEHILGMSHGLISILIGAFIMGISIRIVSGFLGVGIGLFFFCLFGLYGFYLQDRDFARWEENWAREHGK